ncbi:EF-hand [Dendrothele bispora CBS 962.96]|uniref:EF-hand n=1 Tax=Dendrothele bispora (strain CBS 962.96) TaxID=1314807 RepID=A0A4S8KSH8_DENBC|nr:EF-hand [Dendrothele bispora CBS 962.96]
MGLRVSQELRATTSTPGGFAAGRPIGPPPGLLNWIAAVETDNSGRIPAQELDVDVNFLSHFGFLSIPSQTLLLVPQDTDHSGTIGFNEVSPLERYAFDSDQSSDAHLDRDRSGSIDGGELREALSQFGLQLSPQLLDLVQRKYGTTTGGRYQAAPAISFDRFVRACVAVKRLSETFQKLDNRGVQTSYLGRLNSPNDRDGWIQINYDQFMHTMLTHA